MKKLLLTIAMIASLISCDNYEDTSGTDEVLVENLKGSYRSCASQDILNEQLANDPVFAARHASFRLNFQNYMKNKPSSRLVNGTVVIPIHFNILYNTAAQNLPTSTLINQVNILNQDFAGINPNYNWRNPYHNVKGVSTIRFEFAGVTRKYTNIDTWYRGATMKYENATNPQGLNANNPTTKLNFWIVPFLKNTSGGRLLGFGSYPGGNINESGVVQEYKCVGYSSDPNYNLGRTATHEIGHWLNLDHIFGTDNCLHNINGNNLNCINNTDYIDDTPKHDKANFGVPPVNHRSLCTGTPLEMYMNFMDYSDDIALTMFSQGQVDEMEYTISANGPRSSFSNTDNKANIYRFANNSIHRYDRNFAAFPSTAVEGVLGRISQTQLPNTFPLYKFETASGDTYFHFANTMPNYPQYILKGISGYASKTAQPGTGMVPIYEYWGFNHHFYTNNPNELGAAGGTTGWTKAPVTFYLFQ